MLSLSDSAQVHRWAKHLHRLQRNPWIVYGAALAAILIAHVDTVGNGRPSTQSNSIHHCLIAPSNHLIEVTRGLESEADLEGNHDRETEKMEKPS